MKRGLRQLIKCVLVLLLSWALFAGFLTLSAMIPRSAVSRNMAAAAEFYRSKGNVVELVPGKKITVVQHYANSIWLNIAWNLDGGAPFTSAMAAEYYQDPSLPQPDSFAMTVTEGAAPNDTYGRYWHGTAAVLKLLMLVTSVRGIQAVSAAVLLLLTAAFIALCVRRRLFSFCAGTVLGLILCSAYIVPLSFEYTPCFVVTLFFTDLLLWRYRPDGDYTLFFCLAGAAMCFFDFLTAEILGFGLPMLALIALRRRSGRAELCSTVKYGLCWLLAYAATFLAKWCMAAAVSGQSIAQVALDRGAVRVAGELGIGDISLLKQMEMAVTTNLNFVFPMSLAQKAGGVRLIFLAVLAALLCVWFLFRREGARPSLSAALLALLPLARFAALSNHAALHPFMTNRCLIISVAAVCILLGQAADLTQFSRKKTPAKPKKKGAR